MLKRAMLCIFLGVATTIAVALGCAMWLDPAQGVPLWSKPSGIGYVWSYTVHQQPGAVVVWRSPCTFVMKDGLKEQFIANRWESVPRWSAVHSTPDRDETSRRGSRIEHARGWPMVVMMWEQRADEVSGFIPLDPIAGIPLLGEGLFKRTAMTPSGNASLHIIWPNLAVNTAFFAVPWYLIVFMPGILRRAVRRRVGRCAACGYDLRYTVSPRCSECGCVVVGA